MAAKKGKGLKAGTSTAKAQAATAALGRPGFSTGPVSAMIYTLGDSWFTYPTIFDQGAPINLIRALDSKVQAHGAKYFLNEHGEPGATSDLLTAGRYLDQLTRALRDNYDFLLLSMGGNDFVGTQEVNGEIHKSFGDFLLDFSGQSSGDQLLNQQAVSDRLDKTLANYRSIFRLCERLSANNNLQIVAHVYDYPIPSNRGAKVLDRWQVVGPWMYDDLVKRKIPSPLWNDVPRALLTQFATRLAHLAEDLNAHTTTGIKFHVAQTQSTFPFGDESYWINEIHPLNKGYSLLIKKFETIIEPIRDALPPAPWRAWPVA